jgi:hypothetical protein
MAQETKETHAQKKRIEEIKKYLDYIDQCVTSSSFEDIPDNLACIRDELNKLEED